MPAPVDPRLVALSRPTRRWIFAAAAAAAARTGGIVAFGGLFGHLVARIVADPVAVPAGLAADPQAWALLAAAVIQCLVVWVERRIAHRAAATTIADLRDRALAQLVRRDPRTLAAQAPTWRVALGTGLDGLGPYLTTYLPALAATAIGVPAVLAVIWWLDPRSALVAAVTVPLIPLFMVLVGTLTRGRTERRLAGLAVLTDQLLDLVAGLPTLRAFGRIAGPAREVERLAERHREQTMQVLRIAFLSTVVLEFFATISVALVAVGIGLRLVIGDLSLAVGLTVLVIVPEVYQPLRALGAAYHAAVDGAQGWERVLALLDGEEDAGGAGGSGGRDPAAEPAGSAAPVGPAGSATPPNPPGGWEIRFTDLTVRGRDGARPDGLSGTVAPGRLTVLCGPNGSGKSTALLAALGLLDDGRTGTAQVHAVDGATDLHGPQLWRQVSWVPQLGDRAETLADTTPASRGQRQLAEVDRELSRDTSIWLLDEPSAHLDAEHAAALAQRLRAGARAGRTVLVATHDPVLVAAADHVIDLGERGR